MNAPVSNAKITQHGKSSAVNRAYSAGNRVIRGNAGRARLSRPAALRGAATPPSAQFRRYHGFTEGVAHATKRHRARGNTESRIAISFGRRHAPLLDENARQSAR